MRSRFIAFAPSRTVYVFITSLLLLLLATGVSFAQTPKLTPTETVREFYKALREKRFQQAFAMSIYKPAVEGLSAEEFEELRPDFEKMAAAVPENVTISGEQISNDTATVFVKIASGDDAAQAEPITLMRKGNEWVVGDKDNEKIVLANGKEFFIKARIDTHHGEVQAMLERISLAQLFYSKQHDDQFADLPTLINAGLVPKDIEGTDSTGYRFHITVAPGKKSYTAGAEPVRYNRTGRLSFYMDEKLGIKTGDTGGKPFVPDLKKTGK
ncbi:MAG: hypothetical protein WCF57_05620 [Pyrinomonadaceae bacterium]